MTKHALLVGILLAGASCDAKRAATQPSGVNPQPARLALPTAAAIVREYIFRVKPRMNPDALFPLRELTSNDLWERMHVQLFMVTAGVQEDQAYLVTDRDVFPLGTSFGGFGVMSYYVTDLNGDGRPELSFTFSWGSGIHRSLVGLWTGGPSWSEAPLAFGGDLSLLRLDDRHVRVEYGRFDGTTRAFQRQGDLGDLTYTNGSNGQIHIGVELRPDLPTEVRARLWPAGPTTPN